LPQTLHPILPDVGPTGARISPARYIFVLVQPKIVVGNDGKWTGITYLGRAENADAGKKFEIRAILDPKVELKEGEVLSDWPEARAVSVPILVQRK
jgi:hypothetical protein